MTAQPNWGQLVIQGRALDIGVPLPPEFNTVAEYEAVHGKYKLDTFEETNEEIIPEVAEEIIPKGTTAEEIGPDTEKILPTYEELDEMKAKELVEILTSMGIKATTFMGKPKLIDMILNASK